MDTTFVQDGEIVDYTPAAAVVAGDMVFRGNMAYQVVTSAAVGQSVGLRHCGVIRLTKGSSTVFSIDAGGEVYWDSSTELASTDVTKPFVGVAVGGGANGDTYVDVMMNVKSLSTRILRVRATTAQVNAGLTLLPAIPGRKYRLHDVSLIAIGGAAATATSVDILATQSTSSVKLLAAAVAGLTQSTVLRAGAANAAVLADGASFVANDVNTAITIGKTGSALATATNIDVLLTYSVE